MAFKIGYDNLLNATGVTVTASTEAAGFEKENAYDGFGYDWWKPVQFGVSYLEIAFTSGDHRDADYIAIYGHDLYDHGSAVAVQYWTGAAFGGALSYVVVGDNNTLYIGFDKQSSTIFRVLIKSPKNLLLYSEDFTNGAWVSSGTGSVLDNAIISPRPDVMADRLIDSDTDVDQFFKEQTVSVADDGKDYQFICYLREQTSQFSEVSIFLTGGTALSLRAKVTWATHTVDAGSIEDVGDGWYKITVDVTNNSSGNTSCKCRIYPAGADVSEVGGVYAWGAQLTTVTGKVGYVKTEGSAPTSLPSIAGIQIGEAMTMPNNAEVGFAVPTIAPIIETKTAKSESGAFIGGSQLSQGIEGNINFTNIDPQWVRDNWEPFLAYAQTPAVFVMQWDSVTYTDEIMLAWIDGKAPAPSYSSPLYMNFSLKFGGTE